MKDRVSGKNLKSSFVNLHAAILTAEGTKAQKRKRGNAGFILEIRNSELEVIALIPELSGCHPNKGR